MLLIAQIVVPLAISTWLLAILVILAFLFVVVPLVFVIGVTCFPIGFVYAVFWCYFNLFYRLHIHNLDRVPKTGPVMLAPNHISWLDGFLIQLSLIHI